MRKGGTLVMEQQTVEVRFQGEMVGSHSDDCATYTLYRVPDDVYVVHATRGKRANSRLMAARSSMKGWSGRSFRSWPQRPGWIEA